MFENLSGKVQRFLIEEGLKLIKFVVDGGAVPQTGEHLGFVVQFLLLHSLRFSPFGIFLHRY
jgi:hypothetical protein